jgi:hypothetical protein
MRYETAFCRGGQAIIRIPERFLPPPAGANFGALKEHYPACPKDLLPCNS